MAVLTHSLAPWLQHQFQRATERRDSYSMPTTHDEEWRRTSLSYLDINSYTFYNNLHSPRIHRDSDTDILISWTEDGLDIHLSSKVEEEGIIACDLLQEPLTDEIHSRLSENSLKTANNRIVADNLARASFMPCIVIPEGVRYEKPLRVEVLLPTSKVSDIPDYKPFFSSHLRVIMHKNAHATLSYHLRSPEEGEVLCNDGISLWVDEGASLSFFASAEFNLDSTFFHNAYCSLHKKASLKFFHAPLGGLLSKTRFYADIRGSDANVFMGGIFFPSHDEHIDLRSVQHHRAPGSYSRSLYKGAITGEARSVYQGLIHVDPGAQETDAYLTNNNLILSETAQADSIPTLKIENNNLRCSHGSTTGKVNEEHLYYLRSRGLSLDDARTLLIEAHLEEVLKHFPFSMAEDIRSRIVGRINS